MDVFYGRSELLEYDPMDAVGVMSFDHMECIWMNRIRMGTGMYNFKCRKELIPNYQSCDCGTATQTMNHINIVSECPKIFQRESEGLHAMLAKDD